MNLDRPHRRLSVAMALTALLAFAGGAGVQPVSAAVAAVALLVALVHPPGPRFARGLERVLGPLAVVLMVRAAVVAFLPGDVVIPVVDLLLLLMVGECFRAPDASNEVRIYALSFALLLAATAYRPGLVFAVAFVGYVVLASLAIPVGLVRRKARVHGIRSVPLDRAFVLTSLALSLVTLTVGVVVFATFPRVSRAWPGRGEVLARSVAGFADRVSLGEHGSRIHANPEIVLRVEFPDGLPGDYVSFHWRGRSYDRFDGVQWTRTQGVRPSAAPTRWYTNRWGPARIRQEIFAAPLEARVLFGLHPVVDLDARSSIQPTFDNVGDHAYWGPGPPSYSVESMRTPPPADSLRAAGGGFMPDRTRFLQLPRLPDRIAALADSLTREHDNRYDRVVAVERWLRTEFDYTRELPATAAETSLDHFLFERRAGHCEYFSTAMVVLLRSVGIHARNVNGFLGGRWNEVGSYLAVTQNEAHSWVEVWFPGYGWVDFDPTPGGGLGAGASDPWFWPGRLWLDGLQHRWGKWILDYSFDEQSGALRRLTGWLDRLGRPEVGPGAPAVPWLVLLAAALAAGVAASGVRRRGRLRPESALYRDLVRAARRSGLERAASMGPYELGRLIGQRAPEAAPFVQRFLGIYVPARYGGAAVGPDERRALARALSGVRRALRAPRPAVARD